MSSPFLRSVAGYIHTNFKDKVQNLCIVLPNRRAAIFLKNHLSQVFGKTIWLPTIISAEELVNELSGLRTIEEIDLLCHLYESYKVCYGNDAESFESFAKWGQLILQDFNEIDRYLADPEQLYENLKEIKVVENWSLGAENLSEYQKNYLRFMNSLGAIYKHYTKFLIQNKWAYQGLAYRQAVSNTDNELENKYHKIIFCGFNALNAAEIKIIHRFVQKQKAELLWDADRYYLDDPKQEAGMFMRNNFKIFPQKDRSFIVEDFKMEKQIEIISVPKQIGQAQVVKQKLQSLIKQGVSMDSVAVVLANEKLLWPVLQQLPPELEHVNVTMEYPLRYTATYSLIELLIQLQVNFSKQKQKSKTIYYKDLLTLFRQPVFLSYLKGIGFKSEINEVVKQITGRNLAFIGQKHLQQFLGEKYDQLRGLLQPARNIEEFNENITGLLKSCIQVFAELKNKNTSALELEYLQIILKGMNRVRELLTQYPHFNDIHSFKQLFTQVQGNASAPFIGEPLKGLQIMGVLETRTLDFAHLIFVNVNEGVLPSGRTINSFIPNDLKRAFGLPLYAEKDAIYAYHFYRLLQRATDITITYDSETDTFGKGEKSRFVTQLMLEMKRYNQHIKITEAIANYKELKGISESTISLQKNNELLKPIVEKAKDPGQFGSLSPSGLITFKECSLRFFFRYGAGLKELQEVEESAEANTFGTILHLSLEKLYQEFAGKIIQTEDLDRVHKFADDTVNSCFISFFDGNAPVGKSILQEEVLKVYVKKLINNDKQFVAKLKENGHYLTLRQLEGAFGTSVEIEIEGKVENIFIKGKIDRIDAYENLVRVLDYKSSVKDSDKFVFDGFEKLFDDKNYNKQLQLFIYAWLLFKNDYCDPEKLRPGIIPFKTFSEEPLYILGTDKKPFIFNETFFEEFEGNLKTFIGKIFDRQINFAQTIDEKICEFCAYKEICQLES